MTFLVSQNGEFAVRTDLIKGLYIDEARFDAQKYHLRVVIECNDDDITVGKFTLAETARNALRCVVEVIVKGFSAVVVEDIDKAEVSE